MIGKILLFVRFYMKAKTRFQLHSPFVFELVQDALEDERHYYAFDYIEQLRRKILGDHSLVEVTDLGAGSRVHQSNKREVAAICKAASSSAQQGQQLFKLIHLLKPKTVVELGTNLGLGSLYISQALPSEGHLYTLEGCPNLANLAQKHFRILEANNISLINGNFDDTLEPLLKQLGSVDLVYIDGNHTEEATLRYFEWAAEHISPNGCLIFDDIFWSKGMNKAWEAIKKDPRFQLNLECLDFGMVFKAPFIKEKQTICYIPFRLKPFNIGLFK